MQRKTLILTFVSMCIGSLLLAGALEFYTQRNGVILDVEDAPNLAYSFSIVCAISTILSTFYAIRQRHWNPLVRLGLLNSAVLLTILDYYMFYDTNMLACLPILVSASLFVLLKRND